MCNIPAGYLESRDQLRSLRCKIFTEEIAFNVYIEVVSFVVINGHTDTQT